MSQQRLSQFFDAGPVDEDLQCLVKLMTDDLGSSVLRAHVQSTTPRPDITQELTKLNLPIHFIAAEQDQIALIQAVRASQQAIEASQLHKIPGSGHMMLLEQPQKCVQLIESIATNARQSN